MTAAPPDPGLLRAYRYSAGAVIIHWLTVAAVVIQLVLAWRMGGPRSPETFAAFQLHKSVGVTILVLTLVRIGWRLANPPPAMPPIAGWERLLARVTHAAFYVLLIALPMTGWLMVSTSPLRIPTLLYGVIPWPDIPGLATLSAEGRQAWRAVGEAGHASLALLLLATLALHVAGALKHQVFDRELIVLGRILPGARPGRIWEPRLLAVLAALVAVGAIAATLALPSPRAAPPPATPVAQVADAPAASAPAPVAGPAAPTAIAAAEAKVAADAPAPATPAEPVRWTVAPGGTLGFETSWGGQAIEGRFERWRADILFSPDALERSRVKVEIDVASADTGDAQRDASLQGSEWFDAASHATAVFTATRFEKTGPDRYVARGQLSLRGAARDVSLPFRLKIDGDTARASGVTTLDRTAFGVGQGEWTSTDQVPAKVTVRIALTARRS